MKTISTGNLRRSLIAGCLLLVLVSVIGCSCNPEADAISPAVTPFPTSTLFPTPTLCSPTSVPKSVAELEVDTSLLTDDPCRAPCWHDIIPGVSDEDDVRAQLRASPLVRQETLEYEKYEVEKIPYSLFYWQAHGEYPNRISLRDGVVLSIEIEVDHDWTLGEAVDKFGPLEYVLAYYYGEEDYGYHVEFYYPAQGIEFESDTFPIEGPIYATNKGIISEDLKVTLAEYFAPTSLEGMMSEVYSYTSDDIEDWLADIHEWEGFGKVELAR
jgi:hypothetical protein